ncbi:MAG TPA: hypothetical protein VGM10_13445 [Actinocrinis sp.]|jgi:anti-anti-sigma regulatory factor
MNPNEVCGAGPAQLCATVQVERGLVVMGLVGSVTVSTLPALRAAFGRVRAVPEVSAVAVLVEAARFLDPRGAGELALEHFAAHEQGREFFVCGANASLDQTIAGLYVPVLLVRVADLDEARLLAGAVAR